MRFEVHDEMEERMKKTIHVLKSEFASVRTGKASAQVLDSIYVDYYGARTPLNQMASISSPEARTLMVKPFDKSVLGDIENSDFSHKGASQTRNIAYLKLCELIDKDKQPLFYF